MKRNITFLIRKNPRSIGGVQRHSARLIEGISESFNINKVVWKGPEWGAPIYFPYFYLKAAGNGAGLIHCDDAVTAIVGSAIKRRTGKKVVATVHGLDVILPIKRYQKVVSGALRNLDKVVCVSEATAAHVRLRGVPDSKIEVVPNSTEPAPTARPKSEELFGEIQNQTGIDLSGKKILFSLGRPVRRKGFDQFIKNVFVHLPEEFVYIVAGPPQKVPGWLRNSKFLFGKSAYNKLLKASGCDSIADELEKLSEWPRVYYLKTISEELKELLFATSHLFIMPNRSVEGDMEGFGIVAIESAVRGVPVIATGIEGITDAVIHGENGLCIDEGNYTEMLKAIIEITADKYKLESFGSKAREFTLKWFSPEAVYPKYEKIFERLLNESGN